MSIAIGSGTTGSHAAGRPWSTRVSDAARCGASRLFYAVLGAAGVMLWLVMQLPLGARAKGTVVAVMAGCFGLFTLGWHLLAEQAAGSRRR